jgi:hypothetical protein
MIAGFPLFGIVPKGPAMITGAIVPLLALGGIALFVCVGLSTLWVFRHRVHTSQRGRLPVLANLPSQTTLARGLTDYSGKSEIQPIELYFGNSESECSVSISALKPSDIPKRRRALDVSGTKLSKLNPLLQLVSPVLTAAEFGGGDYMRIIVNGPLAVSRDAHFFLPFVRGTDGKVSELARLQDAGRLCEIVNTALVWQFASVIVAQKHLADINKKLDEIRQGIEDILTFLEAERASKIRGALRYLDQAIQNIMQGEFDEALRHHLESVERDLTSVQAHLESELKDMTGKIAGIEHRDVFGTGDFTSKIKTHQDRIYGVQQEWILCVRARVANWQVLSAFPGVQPLVIIRKDDILKSIEEVTAFHPQLNEKMRTKIAEIDAIFNLQETIRERKIALEKRFEQNQDAIMSFAGNIKRQVQQVAANQLLSSQTPMVIALKVEQGRVLEAYELDGTLNEGIRADKVKKFQRAD